MRKKRFNKLIGVMIDEQTYEHLVCVTDELQMPISRYVRKIVEEKLIKIGGQNHDEQ